MPPGFVVKTGAFERFIQALEQKSALRSRIAALNADDLSAASACCAEIRARVEAEELPLEVLDEITSAHIALCSHGLAHTPVAVRSSATTEDAADASFAGLQDTYLWVTDLNQTLQRVRSCWASMYSVESVTYRRRRGVPEEGVAMAVVVQKMVDARTAGVMFTRSPTTGDKSVLTVEGSWGLGSSVVGAKSRRTVGCSARSPARFPSAIFRTSSFNTCRSTRAEPRPWRSPRICVVLPA